MTWGALDVDVDVAWRIVDVMCSTWWLLTWRVGDVVVVDVAYCGRGRGVLWSWT